MTSLNAGRAIKAFLLGVIPVASVAALFLAVWHFGVILSGIHPVLLPGPVAVAQAAYENVDVLNSASLVTGKAALLGFLLSTVSGSIIAIGFSQSKYIRLAFFPYVIFLQTVPIIAIAPLLINWFGYTLSTVVYITVIISLFPIISNVTSGMVQLQSEHRELFEIYRANRWQMLIKLRIPSAVPHLISGMRVSAGLAVVGAIIGDFFVGSGADYQGLGTLMTEWGALQKTADLIGTLCAATLLGVSFFVFINLLAWTTRRRWGT